MALPIRELTAAVCDSDVVALRANAHEARQGGFEVVAEVDRGPDLVHVVELQQPNLLIVANDLIGDPGLDLLRVLFEGSTASGLPPEVILISSDENVQIAGRAAGAFAVTPRHDLDALERVLDEVRELFETGERRSAGDRRQREDRRKTQDWSKVTRERRGGGDRREGSRRDGATGDVEPA
jgi:hypothetical protein